MPFICLIPGMNFQVYTERKSSANFDASAFSPFHPHLKKDTKLKDMSNQFLKTEDLQGKH